MGLPHSELFPLDQVHAEKSKIQITQSCFVETGWLLHFVCEDDLEESDILWT